MLLPAGRLADLRGRRPVLVVGTLASAAVLATLALIPTLAGYLVAMTVFGFGSGLLDVAPAAVVGDVMAGPPGGRDGTVVAAYQMSGDAGSILGPLVAGRLVDSVSYGAGFGATAAVLGGAAVLCLLAPETLPAGRPATDARPEESRTAR